MSEFDGDLQRTLISFRCLEKESKLQGWSKTEENQQLVILPPDAVAERIEIPETDTSPVKTMTV